MGNEEVKVARERNWRWESATEEGGKEGGKEDEL